MTTETTGETIRNLVRGLDQVLILGDPDVCCVDALPLRDARAGCVTLIDDACRAPQVIRSGAAAVVTAQPIQSLACTQLVTDDIHQLFTHLVSQFRPRPSATRYASIHSSAQIDPTASIGASTCIGAGVVIGAGAVIGDHCHLMPGVVVMDHCHIGDHCRIYPNVVIYEHTRIDDDVQIHAGSIIGAHGFGYRQVEGRHVPTAQLGYVHIESGVDVGASVTIDRGTYGVTRIGEGTKIDNLVMIGHNCHIGRHNLLCSQVGIAGSCQTGDYVVLAGQVGLADHITLGDQVVVGAQAGVMENLASDQVYLGSPATTQRDQMQIMAVQRRLPEIRREVKSLRRDVDQLRTQQATGAADGHGERTLPGTAADDDAAEAKHPAKPHCIPFRRPAA